MIQSLPISKPGTRATMESTSNQIADSALPWIVIAAFNEESRLGRTIDGLHEKGYRQIIVVDDGSRDGTAAVVLEHGAWLLRHAVNLGQGAALQTGIAFALKQGAEYIVTFDADGQHDAAEIEAMLEPVRSGTADITLGSRFLGKTVDIPFSRWLILKGGVIFTRIVSNVKVTDTHNGFRAMSRAAALKIHITLNRMAHASELLDQVYEHQLKYQEVPVTIRYTADTLQKGQSSLNAVRIVLQLFLGRLVK
jgi:polyprenyl-phospho-N-acetylgalactosaminyl synthase